MALGRARLAATPAGMKLDERIAKAAQPVLKAGEAIEACTMCTFGAVEMKKVELATAVLLAIATAGAMTIYAVPTMVHLVLTNRRLLVLGQDWAGNPKSAITMEVPRAEIRATPTKAGLTWLAYNITDKDGTAFALVRFAFPSRKAGRQIAVALGAPVA